MKRTRMYLLGLVASLAIAATTQAAPPTGFWNINANGYKGTLVISSVDAAGNVTGTVYGNPIKGFWNESAKQLTFYRATNGQPVLSPELLQIFTGYLFPDSASIPTGVQDLAGYFEGFAGTGATALRNIVGWSATPVTFKPVI